MSDSQSLGDLVKSKAKPEVIAEAQQTAKTPMQQIAEQLAEATNVVTLAEAFRSVKGPQPVAPTPAPPPPEQPIKIEAKLNLNEMMAAKEQSATFALQARDESSKQLWQEREKYFGEKIGNMERLMAEQRAGTKDPITSAREMFGFMREWEEYKSKQLKELGGTASAIPPSNIDAKTLLEMEKFKADTSVSLQKMQHEHDFKMEEMKQQREASTEENKRKWDIEIF